MVNSKLFALGLFSLALLVFGSVYASAGAPIVKTVPLQNVWVADGQTQYYVKVWADNVPYASATPGLTVQFKMPEAQGYDFTLQSMAWPGLNDFFAGLPTFGGFDMDQLRAAKVSDNLQQPLNRRGDFIILGFTVKPSQGSSVMSSVGKVEFDDKSVTSFANAQGQHIYPQTQSVPFTVINPRACSRASGPGAGIYSQRMACSSSSLSNNVLIQSGAATN